MNHTHHAWAEPLRLLCVLAHPDDESLAMGGVLARYAAEGVATYLLTATRGKHGWQGAPEDDPGPASLGGWLAELFGIQATLLLVLAALLVAMHCLSGAIESHTRHGAGTARSQAR